MDRWTDGQTEASCKQDFCLTRLWELNPQSTDQVPQRTLVVLFRGKPRPRLALALVLAHVSILLSQGYIYSIQNVVNGHIKSPFWSENRHTSNEMTWLWPIITVCKLHLVILYLPPRAISHSEQLFANTYFMMPCRFGYTDLWQVLGADLRDSMQCYFPGREFIASCWDLSPSSKQPAARLVGLSVWV